MTVHSIDPLTSHVEVYKLGEVDQYLPVDVRFRWLDLCLSCVTDDA